MLRKLRITTPNALNHRLLTLAIASACVLGAPAFAAEHEGGAGPAPIQLTVNIGPQGSGNVLQAALVLHTTDEETNKRIELYRPMVIHYVNLVANGFSIDELRSVKGKDKLADAIISRLNKELGLSQKSVIDDLFFTNFIVQGG